jgi:hypothetical protein
MIECDGLPIAFRVAGLTFLPIGSFVLIVFLVTGQTIQRRIFESGSQMTLLALDLGMLSHQWEARLVMVERRFLP